MLFCVSGWGNKTPLFRNKINSGLPSQYWKLVSWELDQQDVFTDKSGEWNVGMISFAKEAGEWICPGLTALLLSSQARGEHLT